MKVTASSTTGFSSETTSAFHSTTLKIAKGLKNVQFSDSCMAAVLPSVASAFSALPLPATSVAIINLPDSTWGAYTSFLRTHGSHIIKSSVVGSAFYQWISTASTSSDVLNTMKARACGEVEGFLDGGAFNITACAAYSQEDRIKSKYLTINKKRRILGGTDKASANLEKKVTQENLDIFINLANESTETVSSKYVTVWDVLQDNYRQLCKKKVTGACDNVQRALLLEAAYKGYTAYGCKLKVSVDGIVFQTLRYTAKDADGIYQVECKG